MASIDHTANHGLVFKFLKFSHHLLLCSTDADQSLRTVEIHPYNETHFILLDPHELHRRTAQKPLCNGLSS